MVGSTVEQARADAAAAAARAGVELRDLTEPGELDEARAIFDDTWPIGDATQVTPNLLRALLHAGSHVGAAFDAQGTLRGATLAFPAWTPDGHRHLHSHMAAVRPVDRDRGIGRALKLHQRAWALDHGIDTIAWTFDPLVRRNAELNLLRLGVDVGDYIVDFYGPLVDGINGGEPTDRLVAWWRLDSPQAAAAAAGGLSRMDLQQPRASSATVISVPADIVELRRTDAPTALTWRMSVREQFLTAFARGERVVGVCDDGYVLEAR